MDITDQLKQVRALYENYNSDDAIELINKLLKSKALDDDIKFDLLYMKGMMFYAMRDNPKSAKQCLQECIGLAALDSNKYIDACFLLGEVCYKSRGKDYNKALELFSEIPESYPEYLSARQYMADIYSIQKEYQKALDLLTTLSKKNKNFGKIMHSMAFVYKDMGDFAKMMKCYSNVPTSDPHFGASQLAKALELKAKGDMDAALEAFALIIEVQADSTTSALLNSADILIKQGKEHEAIAIWRKVTTKDQRRYNEAITKIAEIYIAIKDYESALNELDKITPLAYKYITALELKYNIYQAINNKVLETKYYKWLYIALDDLYGYDSQYGDITEQDRLEYWDNIAQTSAEYEYALLQKAIIYKKINDTAKANELLNMISQDKKEQIAEKYNIDLKEIQ